MPELTASIVQMASDLDTLFGKHKFNIYNETGGLKPISELVNFAAKHFSKEQTLEFTKILSSEV